MANKNATTTFTALAFIFALVFIVTGSASAGGYPEFDELTHVIDSARILEADVFSPKMFAKAAKAYDKAKASIEQQKKAKSVRKHTAEAREYIENALKAGEVAKLSLSEYLAARIKAQTAHAPSLVSVLYGKAEKQFIKATAKVESGDVKGALKEAAKSTLLFDFAEMEAIRVDILGAADRLIEKSLADDAGKYALSTLDKARTARRKANALLSRDRYDRDESVAEATRAEYEAKHASNIALSVRALRRNDQAWEKLMLIYEIQMNRVGGAIGLSHLPFDNGPLAAADTLIAYIGGLSSDYAGLEADSRTMSRGVSGALESILASLGQNSSQSDPIALAEAVAEQVNTLMKENNDLLSQLDAERTQFADLTAAHDEISSELAVRLERENKFREAKRLLNPSEGEVLFNSSNDIVLRLSGLSFDIGKSEIKDEHIALLEKIKAVIEMFPGSKLVVEGHTDASGEALSNVRLSEKRAFAIMQYLRQSLLLPADRIRSIGYGADHPVASNQNKSGRAKNRRIDIIIMQ